MAFRKLRGWFLNKKQYINLYDRLGEFLHSDNPWDNEKGYANLAKDIPESLERIRALLQVHATFVQEADRRFAFVVEMGSEDDDVSILTAVADGAAKTTNRVSR